MILIQSPTKSSLCALETTHSVLFGGKFCFPILFWLIFYIVHMVFLTFIHVSTLSSGRITYDVTLCSRMENALFATRFIHSSDIARVEPPAQSRGEETAR